MFNPRPGQWCKFQTKLDILSSLGAWKARDGMYVGIWQPGGYDAFGAVLEGGVAVVSESGDTIVVIRQVAGQPVIRDLIMKANELDDLQPLLDRKDIPPGRKIAEGWEPKA